MKTFILGLMALACASASVIPLLPAATSLVRTPSLDSAIVESQRLNGAFSYRTVENHAYTPTVIQSVPAVYSYIPHYPNIYFAAPQPAYYPTFTYVPQANIPGAGIPLPGPGQPPIEVEDPADNAPNDDIKQFESNSNDDTVTIESA